MNNNIQCSIESSTTSMELNSATDGIYLVPELEGLAGLPEIRTTSGVNAGYDGGWTSAQNYDARLIAIRGVIASRDVAQVEAQRRKLASLLGQGRKEQLTLHFTTEAGNAYTISVRTISCEMALQRVLNKQDFLIQLRADDPLIYDDGASGGTEAILRVQQALGGFEINFGLPLAIGGSSDATAVENGAETVYPIIKLYGPLHSPTVVNMTTNQQMQIIADLGYTITWSGWTGVSGERLSIPNELDKEAPLRLWSVDGNIEQDGTPTPSAPVPVETVTGRQMVTVAGKNLWGGFANDFSKSSSGITFVAKTDGTITNTAGTTSATAYSAFAGEATSNGLTKTLEAGTYCISGASGNITLDVCDTSGTTLATDSGNGATLTLSAQKTIFVRIRVASGKTLTAGTTKPLLESGNQPTAYEPYHGQSYEINLGSIELCKIGTYQDRIYKENGKWWLHKEIGRYDITGTESWGRSGRTTSTVFAGVLNGATLTDIMQIGEDGGLSNRFTYQRNTTAEGAFDTYNWSGGIATSLLFCLSTKKASGITAFKTWLANNPTTYYYVLATPTTTEITNEEILEGLEVIGDATLYVGANNIYTDTPSALPTLEVDYPTDYDEEHDTVVIDSQARTITLNGADIYHLKTEESEFPVLAPGENRMYLTSATTSDTGYAEVKFKQGYLSI